MKSNIVKYYYKCPTTGVEMNFTLSGGYGWGISFPLGIDGHRKLRDANIEIPWPELSAEEQAVVNENYEKLYRILEEDDEQEV